MRFCRAVLDSAFRIPNSAFRLPLPAQRMIPSLSPIINRIDEERQLVYAERFLSALEDFEHKI